MAGSLIPLPSKNPSAFWHPESHELILTLASITTAFSFWNAINIRPSLLTDPGYQEQKNRIQHHMNLSLMVILGISAGFALIYGKTGYLASLAAAGTGITMYVWTSNELNRDRGEDQSPLNIVDMDPASLRIRTKYPVMFRPMGMESTDITHKQRREAGTMD
jgi:hypothetical protein